MGTLAFCLIYVSIKLRFLLSMHLHTVPKIPKRALDSLSYEKILFLFSKILVR